jgi:hypothetical protein
MQQEHNVIGQCLNVESDPYTIFIFAINAEVTKQKYTYRLTKFFDFINLEGETVQQRCRNAVEMDRDWGNNGKWLLNNILRFLQAQKDRVERRDHTGYRT